MGINSIHPSSLGRKHWRPYVQLRKKLSKKQIDSTGTRANIADLADLAELVYPPKSYTDWAREEARARLSEACAWMTTRLNNPVKFTSIPQINPRFHEVLILESVVIVFDYTIKEINIHRIINGKQVKYIAQKYFKSGRFTSFYTWADAIVSNACTTNKSLFLTSKEEYEIMRWVKSEFHRLMLKDHRFQKLVDQTLPKILSLPHERYSIAMATRIDPIADVLPLATYNIVWKLEEQFREVARENPQLLPIVMALCMIPESLCKDAGLVEYLKVVMRECDLSEAGWRYLTRHGSRLFKMVWTLSANTDTRLEVALSYLKALDRAGLPPPPSPCIAKALLHGYCPHDGDGITIESDFCEQINPFVLRSALIEADRYRHTSEIAKFTEDFMRVCAWSEGVSKKDLKPNQIKAGWKWFLNQAQIAEQLSTLNALDNTKHWQCHLPQQTISGWNIVPITNSAQLKMEKMAMRNCLADYEDDCAEGVVEIYSARDIGTGKRKACFGFSFDGRVEMFDAKGFANSPLTRQMEGVGYEIMKHLLNEIASTSVKETNRLLSICSPL